MYYRASAVHSVANWKRISIICHPSQAVNTSNTLDLGQISGQNLRSQWVSVNL